MRIETRYSLVMATTAATLCLATSSHAAGFALIEQGVANMGTAYAGAAAIAEDTSTLFFNPAGMTRLDGTRAAAAVHIVVPQSEFQPDSATYAPALGGTAISGGDGGDNGVAAAVPHTYVSHQINDDTWFGFAVNAPFGLSTKYDNDWVGRYHATESEVMTVNLNPSIAYRVSDSFSIAVGISAQYLDAELSNAVDYGGIDAAFLGGGVATAHGPAGSGLTTCTGAPGSCDGSARVSGDSWGWGFNLGALIAISPATRIGLHYRSEIDHDVKGKADFRGAAQPFIAGATGNTQFVDTDVSADVTLPASASISLYHALTDEWAMVADYTWTGWSSLPELRFDFASAQSDSVTTFNWDDTNRFSIGAIFSPSGSDWVYRAGVAYDETPIPDAEHRTPRLPGEDRIWVALGAGFSPADNMRLDIGYAHLFVDDAVVNKTASLAPLNEDGFRGSLNGSYENSVDILSVQFEMFFH